MNEPKRRGRPPKVKPELLALPVVAQLPNSVPHINGDTSREPEDVELIQAELRRGIEIAALGSSDINPAQEYALRVWSGQSHELKRAERIARVERALTGQGLPTVGIKYPGGADDDEDWTDEDEAPVTWKKAARG